MVGTLALSFLHDIGVSVLLVQEPPRTWLKNRLMKFHVFAPRGPESLTLILVESSLQASIISLGGARACAVRVGVGKESISFVSGYVQPSTGVGSAEIGRALWALGDASLKCLGMDGNGHSPVWGPSSVSANPQGILLENLLASEDFVVINAPNSPPTFMGDDNR